MGFIKNSGQIVGVNANAGVDLHAFLWQNGTMMDLGTLGGKDSFAYAINNQGQAVGAGYTASREEHACLWSW